MSDAVEMSVDVVVLGGGMGGLTAGSYAARHGKSVMVVERAPEIGGTSALSGGHLWTVPSVAAWRERCPNGDERLGWALIEGVPMVKSWLTEMNVEIESPIIVHEIAIAFPFDVLGYFERSVQAIEAAGGHIMRSAVVSDIIGSRAGVTGVIVTDSSGNDAIVRADAIVLATGGLQGDPELRARYIHPQAANVLLRANPWSRGDGLRLGTSVGADLVSSSTGFYGHLICSPLERFEPKDFSVLYQHYSYMCVLVNLAGERFTNEMAGDHLNAQALVSQEESRGLLIFDDDIFRNVVVAPSVERAPAVDKFALAASRGANVAVADSVEELAHAAQEWGFDAAGTLMSVDQFNDGRAEIVSWGGFAEHHGRTHRLSKAPFYAVEVAPAVTFAHSGLRIDAAAHVLDEAGVPIRGLYACGADVGGIYDRGYCGGLALGGVFGLAAARDIVGVPTGPGII
jgi:succinate dehydrogenase/fumarate reductase flavoprotein subunit